MKLYCVLTSRRSLMVAAFLLFAWQISVASPVRDEANKYLPERVGKFQRVFTPSVEGYQPETNQFVFKTEYALPNGSRVRVMLNRAQQDGRAYELLTKIAQALREKGEVQVASNLGTAGFIGAEHIVFFKGPFVVRLWRARGGTTDEELVALGTELSQKLEKGDGDIPVLVKHLPNWEQTQETALYLNRFESPDEIGNDPVLNVIVSDGDADAVIANYNSMRLLIVEFNTPQRAAENDIRIIARIRELWNLGEPAPSAYKRVGNYSVFVFDATNEQTAKQLIDQVKYEQVVSWLGENPNILKEAERQYVQTTLGVLIMVLKASGFALITCFGSGALFGMLLFRWRRSQQRATEAFSDAGGMLRLNLDEMTPQTNPARLLGPH